MTNRDFDREGTDEVKRWIPLEWIPWVEADTFLNPPQLRWAKDHRRLTAMEELSILDVMRLRENSKPKQPDTGPLDSPTLDVERSLRQRVELLEGKMAMVLVLLERGGLLIKLKASDLIGEVDAERQDRKVR